MPVRLPFRYVNEGAWFDYVVLGPCGNDPLARYHYNDLLVVVYVELVLDPRREN